MATVTFTFGNKTRSFTVSAANVARFVAWAAAAYPTVPNPAYPSPDANGKSTVPATLPNPEPVLSAIDGLWAGLRANVINHEKQVAMKAIATPEDLT